MEEGRTYIGILQNKANARAAAEYYEPTGKLPPSTPPPPLLPATPPPNDNRVWWFLLAVTFTAVMIAVLITEGLQELGSQ